MSARNTLPNKAARRAARVARHWRSDELRDIRYEAASHDEELDHASRASRRVTTRKAALARPHAACGALPVEGRANRSDARRGAGERAKRVRERRAALRLARRASR